MKACDSRRMSKFRVKSGVTFEAQPFNPSPISPDVNLPDGVRYDGLDHAKEKHWSIPSEIGHLRVTPGDYVVTDERGQRFVFSGPAFSATFEQAIELASVAASPVVG